MPSDSGAYEALTLVILAGILNHGSACFFLVAPWTCRNNVHGIFGRADGVLKLEALAQIRFPTQNPAVWMLGVARRDE